MNSISNNIGYYSARIRGMLADIEHRSENALDIASRKYGNVSVEEAFRNCKNRGITFNGFALTESSLRIFFHLLLREKKQCYSLIELGGGQSTIFLDELSKLVQIQKMTYEHDITWVHNLQSKIRTVDELCSVSLRQIDSQYREMMFAEPWSSYAIWKEYSREVAQESHSDLRMENCFYNIAMEQISGLALDGLIVDGPHGNGRSICFPLFRDIVKHNTLILIDDYHHYPFMSDLERIYKYQLIEKRKYKYSNKGWVIVKIVDA